MVKRDVVGAHYGLRDWLAQRVTAVVMAVYTLIILSAVISLPSLDYANWKALWQSPLVKYATVLFVASLLLHAWIGVRNIFMDYVKVPGLRVALYALTLGALLLYAFWAVQILWS